MPGAWQALFACACFRVLAVGEWAWEGAGGCRWVGAGVGVTSLAHVAATMALVAAIAGMMRFATPCVNLSVTPAVAGARASDTEHM